MLEHVHVTVPQRASVFDLVRVSVLIVSVRGLRELHLEFVPQEPA